MRQITSHMVGGMNDVILIQAADEPGPGGANHSYRMAINGADNDQFVKFQKGPVKEAGVNGVSNEALLAIVLDRLEGFQSGEFKCRENAIAFTKIQEAMHWLHHRTRDRVKRAVEGTMVA